MGVKQTLKPDHIPVNKYKMLIAGVLALTFTKVSGIEYTLGVADLPDRTRSPGGNANATEFTVEQPLHHLAEVAAMELWFEGCQDPISSTAKKAVTLIMTSGTGARIKTYTMTGVWPSARKTPDLDYANDGDMAVIEWTFQADDMLPV